MCQTLAQGGKRCDTHKDGSKAVVSLSSIMANVSEKIVRPVFKSLKKEGKGLEAPAKEEVDSFAETGKFQVKHDKSIPERKKNSMIKQFENAKNEEPSGALFHAWKYTPSEVLRRSRKMIMATGVAASLMATSACGGGAGLNPDNSPSPSASPSTTISAPATPSAAPTTEAPTPTVTPGSVVNGIPTKSEIVNNGRGEYIQTTISPDDPAMKYNPQIVDAAASSNFSPDDITAAQRVAVTFTAEETLDSTANGGNEADKEAWWQKNQEKFHPLQREEIHQTFKNDPEGSGLVIIGGYRNGYDFNYGPDKTRVVERVITPTYVKGLNAPDGQPYLGITMDVAANSSFSVDGQVKNETSTGFASYSMLKDTDGQWKIVGFQNEFTTTPLK